MKKILVIQTASLGDVILATALLESLHLEFPEAALDLLVKKGNENLFLGHPFLHKVIVWDKRSHKFYNLFRITGEARKTGYNLVINIQRFLLTGLLTIFSGGSETRGFLKNPLSFLFTRSIKHSIASGVHEVIRNHALINDLVKPGGNLLPRLYPSLSDEAAVEQFATSASYTISPASLWYTKQYPTEKWVELVCNIPHEAGVYLLGSLADHQLCEDIIAGSGHPGAVNLAGRLTFLQSAALMKKVRMNYTNDSAPMHLASSVNAPVTAIYCSTIPGFGFGPLSLNSVILEIGFHISCRPCGLH